MPIDGYGTAEDAAVRPEIRRSPLDARQISGELEHRLNWAAKLWNAPVIRKVLILAFLLGAWEAYARGLDNELLVPTFTATVRALVQGLSSGVLIERTLYSLEILLAGYGLGLAIAFVLTFAALKSRIGADFLETLTAMFNPLPSIALLPLALLWFGIGTASLVFTIVHGVLWAVALNMHAGFRSVSRTLRMVGQNCGLSGVRFMRKILLPAALPSIIAGLRIGWAFAWRTLIAAELVFGVSSGSGGIGWFIFESKNMLEIPSVFAGLFIVIAIGLLVENVGFRELENRTVRRWGLQS